MIAWDDMLKSEETGTGIGKINDNNDDSTSSSSSPEFLKKIDGSGSHDKIETIELYNHDSIFKDEKKFNGNGSSNSSPDSIKSVNKNNSTVNSKVETEISGNSKVPILSNFIVPPLHMSSIGLLLSSRSSVPVSTTSNNTSTVTSARTYDNQSLLLLNNNLTTSPRGKQEPHSLTLSDEETALLYNSDFTAKCVRVPQSQPDSSRKLDVNKTEEN